MHNVSVWGYLHQHRLIYPLKMLGASLSSLNDQQMLLSIRKSKYIIRKSNISFGNQNISLGNLNISLGNLNISFGNLNISLEIYIYL